MVCNQNVEIRYVHDSFIGETFTVRHALRSPCKIVYFELQNGKYFCTHSLWQTTTFKGLILPIVIFMVKVFLLNFHMFEERKWNYCMDHLINVDQQIALWVDKVIIAMY